MDWEMRVHNRALCLIRINLLHFCRSYGDRQSTVCVDQWSPNEDEVPIHGAGRSKLKRAVNVVAELAKIEFEEYETL
jgi:hypothetical protein